VGGPLTLAAPPVPAPTGIHAWELVQAAQSRGISLTTARVFAARAGDGPVVTAATLTAVLRRATQEVPA